MLPIPRTITRTHTSFTLPDTGLILAPPQCFFEAKRLQTALGWEIAAATSDRDIFTISLTSANTVRQRYRLDCRPDGIDIIGGDHAGVFYGVCTLLQLLTQPQLETLTIDDWPDFAVRGVMLDVSRDRVPTMETLYLLIDQLASLKINQFQLYMEHTFAYAQHRQVWEHASPFTPQEILELDAFCRQRHIDLVPNQNSFGHMERWLKHPRYRDLAECPDGFDFAPWGHRPPATLNPNDPRSLKLIRGLYDELLPHFTSRLFNVGADEPFELGKGASKHAVAARGGRVYLDYLLELYRLVTERRRQMLFWGDIITHYPDLIPELPQDLVALEWGYEADHDFNGHCAMFAQSGIPFYVCPGTSSWLSLAGRTDNAIANLRNAAENGLKYGAVGFLNTSWGDHGHWDAISANFVGFTYGAAVSWCYETNRTLDLPAALDQYVFLDETRVMGTLAYDLGNVYRMISPREMNGSILMRALQWNQADLPTNIKHIQDWNGSTLDISPNNLRQIIDSIDHIIEPINRSLMRRADARLLKDEFRQAAHLLQHGAKWLLLAQGATDYHAAALATELDRLIAEQRHLWLARSREGGLADSLARFEPLQAEYQRLAAPQP